MVFELWFQSDEAGENSGSVGGKLGGNSLSLRLGSAREEESFWVNPRGPLLIVGHWPLDLLPLPNL